MKFSLVVRVIKATAGLYLLFFFCFFFCYIQYKHAFFRSMQFLHSSLILVSFST